MCLFAGGGGGFFKPFVTIQPICASTKPTSSVVLSFASLLGEGNEKPQTVFIDITTKGYWSFTMIDDCFLDSKNMVWASEST